eukprot:scaffold24174_cov127-Isochrysis_galbana.AAC.7
MQTCGTILGYCPHISGWKGGSQPQLFVRVGFIAYLSELLSSLLSVSLIRRKVKSREGGGCRVVRLRVCAPRTRTSPPEPRFGVFGDGSARVRRLLFGVFGDNSAIVRRYHVWCASNPLVRRRSAYSASSAHVRRIWRIFGARSAFSVAFGDWATFRRRSRQPRLA